MTDRTARCSAPGVDPEVFVSPVKKAGETSSDLHRERVLRATIAKQICKCCPIRFECLTEALNHQNRYRSEIRGGYTASERRQYLEELRNEAS